LGSFVAMLERRRLGRFALMGEKGVGSVMVGCFERSRGALTGLSSSSEKALSESTRLITYLGSTDFIEVVWIDSGGLDAAFTEILLSYSSFSVDFRLGDECLAGYFTDSGLLFLISSC